MLLVGFQAAMTSLDLWNPSNGLYLGHQISRHLSPKRDPRSAAMGPIYRICWDAYSLGLYQADSARV